MKPTSASSQTRTATRHPQTVLLPRDVAVVRAVWAHRCLSRDQIRQLFFPSTKRANARLQRLYRQGYLTRTFVPPGPERNARNSPGVYGLGRRGRALLGLTGAPTPPRPRPLFLTHLLQVNDFRIALTLAARARGDRLVRWLPEWTLRGYRERATDPQTGERFPVAPDGYGVLEQARSGRRCHFFLELDRGTMTARRFGQKVRGYLAYVQGGGYAKRYGTHSVRVLTVTVSEGRLRSLKAATERVGGRRRFWFTAMAEVTPERVLGSVWQLAGETKRCPLLRDARE